MGQLILLSVISVLLLTGCSFKQSNYESCIQECKKLYNMSYNDKNKFIIPKAKAAFSIDNDKENQRQSGYNYCINSCVNKHK